MIAFVGFKSSGKNTAAEALAPHKFVSFSFADALKDSLAAIFCWDRAMLAGITAESRAWREEIDVWWAAKLDIPQFSPRWAMTHVGTDIMRRYLSADLWVYNVERRIMMLDDATSVVLTDARFPNEIALAYRCNGRVFRIKRGPDPSWMEVARMANTESSDAEHYQYMLEMQGIHSTEYAWIGAQVDGIIDNDGTITELHNKIIERVL